METTTPGRRITRSMTVKSENQGGFTGITTKEKTIEVTAATSSQTNAAAHKPKQQVYIRPAVAEDRFGLIQESIANNLYFLCVQAILWNQTTGRQARPVFESLIARYPDVEALAVADSLALTAMLNPIGLHNIRAKRLIDMAKTWTESPPSSDFVRARKGYPLFMPDDERREKEFEIVHLPGMGPYALDSYRIFHRDQLRGLAKDWNGKGASAGFEQEWKRVLPLDKDLRVFLEWMWRKEGWAFDIYTGERKRLV